MLNLFLKVLRKSITYLCITLILSHIAIPCVYGTRGAGRYSLDALVDIEDHIERHHRALQSRLPELKEDLRHEDPRLQISIQDLHTPSVHKPKSVEVTLWGVGTLFGFLAANVSGVVVSSDGPTRGFLNMVTSYDKDVATQIVTTIGIAPSEAFKFTEAVEDHSTHTLPTAPLAQKNTYWALQESLKLFRRIGILGLSLKAVFAGYNSLNPNNIPYGVRLFFAGVYGISKYLGMTKDFDSSHRNLCAAVMPGPPDVAAIRSKWEGKLVGIGRAALTNPAFAERLYDAFQDLNKDTDKEKDPTRESQRVANYASFLLLDRLLEDEDAPKFSPPPVSKLGKVGRFFWPEDAPLWWKCARLAGMGAGLFASGSIWYGSYLAWANTVALLLPSDALTVIWATVSTTYMAPTAAKASSSVVSRSFARVKEGARSLWNWGKRKLGYEVELEGIRHDNPLLWSRDFEMTDVSNPATRGLFDAGAVVLSYFAGLPVSLLGGLEMFNRGIDHSTQLWTLGPATFALGEMDNPSLASYTDRMISYFNSKLPARYRDEIGHKQTFVLRYLRGLALKVGSNSDGFIRGLNRAVEADRAKSQAQAPDGSDSELEDDRGGVHADRASADAPRTTVASSATHSQPRQKSPRKGSHLKPTDERSALLHSEGDVEAALPPADPRRQQRRETSRMSAADSRALGAHGLTDPLLQGGDDDAL